MLYCVQKFSSMMFSCGHLTKEIIRRTRTWFSKYISALYLDLFSSLRIEALAIYYKLASNFYFFSLNLSTCLSRRAITRVIFLWFHIYFYNVSPRLIISLWSITIGLIMPPNSLVFFFILLLLTLCDSKDRHLNYFTRGRYDLALVILSVYRAIFLFWSFSS